MKVMMIVMIDYWDNDDNCNDRLLRWRWW